jgi:hypothetical protein
MKVTTAQRLQRIAVSQLYLLMFTVRVVIKK